MGHRDAEGIHLSEENWAKISVDTMGFSSEKLIRALEAQMAGKSRNAGQEGASLASGDLATARRDWFQDWYRKLGFNLSVPFPPVSDEEFKRREGLGQALFYRPATSEVSYKALMSALGQGEHWTVTDKDHGKIVWEPTEQGYWFWAEVAESCPRLGTSWNKLTKKEKLNLLSLEEYVIVWWATKTETNTLLDVRTWSWLRTRFGSCALRADEYDGRVDVYRWNARDLSHSCGDAGGRVAEVVKIAA